MRTRVAYSTAARWGGTLMVVTGVILATAVASPSPAATPTPAGTASPKVIKYTAGFRMQSVIGRPDTDMVEFASGKRVSLGDMRRLEAVQRRLRAVVPNSRYPWGLEVKPAGNGTPLKNSGDLVAALKRGDREEIKAQGSDATIWQVKFVQPIVEKRLGRKLDTLPQRPSLDGPAESVSLQTPSARWKELMRGPDSQILMSPTGKRVTVGELKAAVTWLYGPNSARGRARALKPGASVAPGASAVPAGGSTAPTTQPAPVAVPKKR
jgi:hypothetical protein